MAHVLFDVNGTLLDPRALTASWEGAPSGLGLSILDQTVLQSMVDTITGEFRPFPEYIRAALAHRAALAGLGDDAVQSGMGAAAALPPYPDADDALSRLRVAGHTPSALTNSAADAARSALRDAGLLDHFHAVMSVEAVGAYKPDLRVYAHALEVLGASAADTWFVAGHWGDVTGAKRAGLRTVWIGRDEGPLIGTAPEPDIRAADLKEAAEAIAAA
ncbi:MAG: 2-haloacid dehalogenase [Solirubrobacteraceae bacterium]|nr:2-haloacid dehalogenase [Solirubrobacteraceae bacterium]